jgi:hypothetical protein
LLVFPTNFNLISLSFESADSKMFRSIFKSYFHS